jgi:hypothetical protein
MPDMIRVFTKGALLAALWLLDTGALASAQAESWQLVRADGAVRVMEPGTALARGREGMSLVSGTVIITGPDSNAELTRASQKIRVSADTRIELVETSEGLARIRQEAGQAFYQVNRREIPHFQVDTALIAAVVKGTDFSVSVGPEEHIVEVAHGLVEVRLPSAGQGADVNPGQAAIVDRLMPSRLRIERAQTGAGRQSAYRAQPINDAASRLQSGPAMAPSAPAGSAGSSASPSINEDRADGISAAALPGSSPPRTPPPAAGSGGQALPGRSAGLPALFGEAGTGSAASPASLRGGMGQAGPSSPANPAWLLLALLIYPVYLLVRGLARLLRRSHPKVTNRADRGRHSG